MKEPLLAVIVVVTLMAVYAFGIWVAKKAEVPGPKGKRKP